MMGALLAISGILVVLVLIMGRVGVLRQRANPVLGAVWLLVALASGLVIAGVMVVTRHAAWACPGTFGCRSGTFVPADMTGQVQMAYRLLGWLSLLVSGWMALSAARTVQVRAVRLVANLGSLLALMIVVGNVVLPWRIVPTTLPALIIGGCIAFLVANGALLVVVQCHGRPAPKTVPDAPVTKQQSIVRDLVTLTKPRVISLLILTTLAAMLLATDADHRLNFRLVVWTLVGGYLAAGGANAINMYLDRDVDALMGRTSRRPLPSSRLAPIHALIFGLVLNVLAFAILTLTSNVLAAGLAIGGSVYYVLIYTRLMKRTTHHNIIIGGAAGAVPPLVGWAAVQGQLNLMALLLFAIIFYWTPPHFWALALMRRADYARAGIPMLPVAKGEAETKWQILLYSLLMFAISVVPAPLRLVGPIYLLLALALGLRFLQVAFRLFREPGTTQAWPLYKYSLLYLALLFGALVVDHLVMLRLA